MLGNCSSVLTIDIPALAKAIGKGLKFYEIIFWTMKAFFGFLLLCALAQTLQAEGKPVILDKWGLSLKSHLIKFSSFKKLLYILSWIFFKRCLSSWVESQYSQLQMLQVSVPSCLLDRGQQGVSEDCPHQPAWCSYCHSQTPGSASKQTGEWLCCRSSRRVLSCHEDFHLIEHSNRKNICNCWIINWLIGE